MIRHPPAIEVEALVKVYREVATVRSVSFTVARGEVFDFLGPNSASKGTTVNMLCTLARPTSGTGTTFAITGPWTSRSRRRGSGRGTDPVILVPVGVDRRINSTMRGPRRELHAAYGRPA